MRLLATFAVLAATLAAPPALAQGRAPMNGAVLLGFEDGDFDAGLSLRGDLELVQKPLAPNVGFSIVGSLGFARFGEEGGYYAPPFVDERWEMATNVLKIVPAARLTFGRSQAFRPYVDGGIGVYYASWTMESREVVDFDLYGNPIYRDVEFDDSEFSLMMRLAAGLQFQVSPGFSLGGELSINPYFGDYDDTTFGLMVGASFRM
jgi:hypothetical protein